MSKKYKNKYRNESSRLPNWDYGRDAAYFITICTKDREYYFGEIKNGKMQVSPAGGIAYVLWGEIGNRVKNVRLGQFVIMPNHIHGILIIDGIDGIDENIADDNRRDVACNVPTNRIPTNKIPITNHPEQMDDMDMPLHHQMSQISPKSNSVSTIIRSYKSAVTKYCNRLDLPFTWQSRFHDHIIRNDESFHRISNYIKNNPANWKEDSLF